MIWLWAKALFAASVVTGTEMLVYLVIANPSGSN